MHAEDWLDDTQFLVQKAPKHHAIPSLGRFDK